MDEIHPLALILEIAQLARRYVETGLAAQDLTFNQYNLLQLLASHDYLHPSKAAELLSINRPTTTVILRNLEKKGWVVRRPDPESRRNVRISLTPSGRAKAKSIQEWVVRVKGSLAPLIGLEDPQVEALGKCLLQVRNSVAEQVHSLAERIEQGLGALQDNTCSARQPGDIQS